MNWPKWGEIGNDMRNPIISRLHPSALCHGRPRAAAADPAIRLPQRPDPRPRRRRRAHPAVLVHCVCIPAGPVRTQHNAFFCHLPPFLAFWKNKATRRARRRRRSSLVCPRRSRGRTNHRHYARSQTFPSSPPPLFRSDSPYTLPRVSTCFPSSPA